MNNVRSQIGNVKDIIDSSTAAQDEYLDRFDKIRQYMVAMNVPKDTMDRVKQWCQVRPSCRCFRFHLNPAGSKGSFETIFKEVKRTRDNVVSGVDK